MSTSESLPEVEKIGSVCLLETLSLYSVTPSDGPLWSVCPVELCWGLRFTTSSSQRQIRTRGHIVSRGWVCLLVGEMFPREEYNPRLEKEGRGSRTSCCVVRYSRTKYGYGVHKDPGCSPHFYRAEKFVSSISTFLFHL